MGALEDLASGNVMLPPAIADTMWSPKTNILKHLVESIRDTITTPRRAMEQGITTEEAIPWAANMGMKMAGAPVTMAQPATLGSGAVRQGIKAYHSSPHDFDRFDISKVGTGQGAQSYGHGIYAAENPKVSGQGGQYWQEFAKRFIGRKDDPEGIATNALLQSGGDREKAIKFLYDPKYNTNPPSPFREAIDLLRSDKPVGPRTYELNIRAKPEEFLDWDKPIAQQPSSVQSFWEKQYPKRWLGEKEGQTGQSIYKNASLSAYEPGSLQSAAPKVSESLRDAGLPGIKYLDQGSRSPHLLPAAEAELAKIQEAIRAVEKQGGGQNALMRLQRLQDDAARTTKEVESLRNPTRNYVLFRDDIIDILRKYGLAGSAGPLGALMTQGQDGRQ